MLVAAALEKLGASLGLQTLRNPVSVELYSDRRREINSQAVRPPTNKYRYPDTSNVESMGLASDDSSRCVRLVRALRSSQRFVSGTDLIVGMGHAYRGRLDVRDVLQQPLCSLPRIQHMTHSMALQQLLRWPEVVQAGAVVRKVVFKTCKKLSRPSRDMQQQIDGMQHQHQHHCVKPAHRRGLVHR